VASHRIVHLCLFHSVVWLRSFKNTAWTSVLPHNYQTYSQSFEKEKKKYLTFFRPFICFIYPGSFMIAISCRLKKSFLSLQPSTCIPSTVYWLYSYLIFTLLANVSGKFFLVCPYFRNMHIGNNVSWSDSATRKQWLCNSVLSSAALILVFPHDYQTYSQSFKKDRWYLLWCPFACFICPGRFMIAILRRLKKHCFLSLFRSNLYFKCFWQFFPVSWSAHLQEMAGKQCAYNNVS
jgi:hypothetical protein